MKYVSATCSDKGTVKQTNEDSLALRVAETDHGQIAFAIVCDGVGGFSKGELASGTVVQIYIDWFEKKLPLLLQVFKWGTVAKQWEELTDAINKSILAYSEKNKISLGTTAVAALMYNEKMMVLNVGDSRLYEIKTELVQLTKDQSVVQREVDLGRLKPEEMETDSRRNVLLQCIGATRHLIPDITLMPLKKDTTYMLCSDGFRHKLEEKEITAVLAPSVCTSSNTMDGTLNGLVEIIKQRNERDNISVIAIRTSEQ